MTTLNIAELSTTLDTDARTARKFLRTVTPIDDQPGKGSRWIIEAKQVRSLKAQFKKFTAAQDEAKKVREDAILEEATREVLDEDREPTAEELDDMARTLEI